MPGSEKNRLETIEKKLRHVADHANANSRSIGLLKKEAEKEACWGIRVTGKRGFRLPSSPQKDHLGEATTLIERVKGVKVRRSEVDICQREFNGYKLRFKERGPNSRMGQVLKSWFEVIVNEQGEVLPVSVEPVQAEHQRNIFCHCLEQKNRRPPLLFKVRVDFKTRLTEVKLDRSSSWRTLRSCMELPAPLPLDTPAPRRHISLAEPLRRQGQAHNVSPSPSPSPVSPMDQDDNVNGLPSPLIPEQTASN